MNTQQVLARFAEVTGEAVLACDLTGHVTYANPAATQLSGWTVAQLQGKSCQELLATFPLLPSPKCASPTPSPCLASTTLDTHLRLPSGESLAVQVEIDPLYDGEEVNGALLRLHDARDASSVLQALRESETDYRKLVDNMLNGLVQYQVVLDENGKPVDALFCAANQAFEQITGIRREAVIGMRLTAVRPEVDREWVELIGRVALTGESVRVERYSENLGKWFSMLAYCPREGFCAIVAEDITEQRAVAQALAESEANYRELVEAASTPIVKADGAARLTFANHAALELLGRSEHGLLGEQALGLICGDDPSAHRRLASFLLNLSAGPSALQFEVQLPTGNGEGRWVSWTVQSIRAATDGHSGLLCLGADVTARKAAELALQKSEEWYRLLFARSPLGIFHYTSDLRISDCNERFAAILQSQRSRIVGIDLTTLRDRRILPALRGALEGHGGRFEGRYEATNSPATPWLVLHTASIYGPSGEITGGVGIIEDISDRKAAEEQAQQRQCELLTLLDSLPGYAFLKNGDGMYVTANRQFCQAVGNTREQIVGCTDHELFPTALAERFAADDEWVLRNGEPLEVEEQMLDQGRLVVVATRKEPLRDGTGAVSGLIGLSFDLTDRKRAEDSQRLASVGQLAAGVAHEFNNLLAAIMMKAELAIFRRDSQQYHELALMVLRASRRGASICHNLTAFAGPHALRPVETTVNEPLEAALTAMSAQFEHSGVEVVRHYTAGALPLSADVNSLEQVFVNVLLNACHAMPHGGRITIRTRTEQTALGTVVITAISDTGSGIPPENLPRVFEPFFTTKGLLGRSDTPGTGLGLSVSHGIVHAHGGHIEIKSPPGEGVTVEVALPVQVADNGKASLELGRQVGIAAAAARELRVLLVEDEPQVRDLIKHILDENGCVVRTAPSTSEALVALQTEVFDLVIADWLMPGGGGREVAAVAKALPDPPPVVVITGSVDPDVTEELLNTGVLKRLLKPFHVADLMAVVNEIRLRLEL